MTLSEQFVHHNIGRLHITRFNCVCEHTPKNLKWFRLVKIDMQAANGVQCKTRRFWLYFKTFSYCIDWR